ncbi:hypothetical protein VTN02DRAFT_534 [Thermoascus thermophilus]
MLRPPPERRPGKSRWTPARRRTRDAPRLDRVQNWQGNSREGNNRKKTSGVRTVPELLRLEEMRRPQVRESMRVRDRTAGAGRASTRRQPAHHGPSLTDLRAGGRGDSRMHLLHHARTGRLAPQVCRVGVLGLSHWVARREPGVRRDALMGSREGLRHHHR